MPSSPSRASLILAVALVALGCRRQSLAEFPQCVLDIELAHDEGAFDDPVTITGREFSERYDTVVTIGGMRAPVDTVERQDCTFCDLCRQATASAGECDICEACATCESACASCTQEITLRVPDVPPGWTDLVLINRYGASAPVPFLVLVAADTDEPDEPDTGRR